uniref:Uncharacterized protein n=1 Tax=Vespula pensylvanica TaxID=30213 RepID=A0A834PCG9_VESPE|nr:hypothetical protein H0235_003701 [Vespula pensylvanica]
MVYPPNQTVTANEGEPLDVIVEFCAEPSYTRVFWMSEQQVYVPGGPSRDGIQALGIENGGTETCYRAILRFETIQWSHAGEWLLLPRPPPFDGSSDSPSLPDLGHYTTAASTLNHTVVRIFGKSFEGDESGERRQNEKSRKSSKIFDYLETGLNKRKSNRDNKSERNVGTYNSTTLLKYNKLPVSLEERERKSEKDIPSLPEVYLVLSVRENKAALSHCITTSTTTGISMNITTTKRPPTLTLWPTSRKLPSFATFANSQFQLFRRYARLEEARGTIRDVSFNIENDVTVGRKKRQVEKKNLHRIVETKETVFLVVRVLGNSSENEE